MNKQKKGSRFLKKKWRGELDEVFAASLALLRRQNAGTI